MTRRIQVSLVLLALVTALAGCSDTPSAPDDLPDRTDVEETKRPSAPPSAGEAGIPKPEWAVGDWWRWRIAYQGHDIEVTTGVAAIEGDTALVGVAEDADADIAPWFHTPPMGRVDMDGLAYEAHDLPMRFLRFPLMGGETWEGELEGDTISLNVSATGPDGRLAIEGRYESGRLAVELEYGVVEENLVHLALHYGGATPWAEATLIGFGQDLDASLWVPSLDDLYLGSVWREAPTDTRPFEIEDDVTHLLIGCEVGGTAGTGSATLLGPDGRTTSCPREPRVGDTSMAADVIAVPATPGQWVLDLKSVGDAFVSVEMSAMTLVEA